MSEFKKYLIFCAVMLAVGAIEVGCTIQKPDASNKKEIPRVTMSYFELNGHNWIIYSGGDVFDGVLHDPDCKCNKGK